MERRRKTTSEPKMTSSGVMPRVDPRAADNATSDSLRDTLTRERTRRIEAEQNLAAQSRWIAEVSHEMRSTLTAILVWADVIATAGSASPRVALALETIAHNARRHLRLSEDMLDYSAARSGQLRIRRERVDLRAVVAHAVDSVAPSAAKRGVTLRADLFEHDATLVGDADRLEEVFVNVLWNALNHTPPDGSILVECSSNALRHRIIVLDTGTGIPRALLPAVFEPFGGEIATVPAAITRGAGLGLAVTKAIVTAHGGEIVVASDGEERGTMVTITIPVSGAA